MATDEMKTRQASEKARDELNQRIKYPGTEQQPDNQDLEGPGIRSPYRDPSTMDGKLRWD